MPGAFLEWRDKYQNLHRRTLVDKIFLGRACKGMTADKSIIVQHPTVSRDHAMIQLKGNTVEITDQGINGTLINGVRMAPGSSRTLENGDEIQLGDVSIQLSCQNLAVCDTAENWEESTYIKPASVTVTNLVADVRGFSSLSQTVDSSMTYTLMKEIFASFSDIVSAYNGTVKDYAGDAVFAFWEHSQGPSPQRAVLACRAAIRQFESLPGIEKRLARDNIALNQLRLGWGLTTGPATLSHYGLRSADLALVGDCINLAFRLSSMANKDFPQSIILCPHTAELVREEVQMIDLGLVRTKGRSGREHVYGLK